MKILIITPSYKPAFVYGGPIFSVAYLAENLSKNNKVFVLSTNANGIDNLNIDTKNPIQIDGVDIRFFKRQTKDHSHFSVGLLNYLWNHGEEFQVIHIQSWWNTVAVLSALICKLRGWKFVVSPRGMLSPYTLENSRFKKFLHKIIGNNLLKSATIHVTSNDEKLKLIHLNPKYKLVDIPNFVDLNINTTISRESSNSELINLLFLSRIHPKKGLNDLFSALSRVDFDFKLSIVGDGDVDYITSLKNLSNTLKISDRISWEGPLYNQDKINAYVNADVFILPSKDENFANTVLESLSQGTAVIVSKNVGLSDFVQQNNLGWVYDGSETDLIRVLIDCMQNPSKLQYIRNNAAVVIRNKFSEKSVTEQYIALYNNILI